MFLLEEDSIVLRGPGRRERSAESPAGPAASPHTPRKGPQTAGPRRPLSPWAPQVLLSPSSAKGLRGPALSPEPRGYLEPGPSPASGHGSRSRAATSAATAATAPAPSAAGSCIRVIPPSPGFPVPSPPTVAPLPDPPWGVGGSHAHVLPGCCFFLVTRRRGSLAPPTGAGLGGNCKVLAAAWMLVKWAGEHVRCTKALARPAPSTFRSSSLLG